MPAALEELETEHSHRTNLIRSLAHHGCNCELRALSDSPKVIREKVRHYQTLLRYLRDPPGKVWQASNKTREAAA
jgi:hypothetical protein